MRLMQNAEQLWLRPLGTQGAAFLEAAIVFPFLVLSYIGIVGLTQYMETHRHIFQSANQVATAMSLERSGNKPLLANILKFANISTSPDDISISYIFCGESQSAPGVIAPTSPVYQGTAGKGTCGKGAGKGSNIVNAVCPATSPGPDYGQFVVVTTSCQYTPAFNAFGLINLPLSTTVNIPFREFNFVIP